MTTADDGSLDDAPGASSVSRRRFLQWTGGLLAGMPLFYALPAGATPVLSPARLHASGHTRGGTLWYSQPATEDRMLFEGLPVGNGHLGALVGGGPAHDVLHMTEASLWTGGRNSTLLADGQFPYDHGDFGSFTQLATLVLDVPTHALAEVAGYRRELDLAQGCARVTYQHKGVRYQRELFVSHPDNVLVWHLSQDGGGGCSGQLRLQGSHGEATHDGGPARIRLTGHFHNGLRHAAVVSVRAEGGRVVARDGVLHFKHCTAVTVVMAAVTNYIPSLAQGFIDSTRHPLDVAGARVDAALAQPVSQLLARHVDDHRGLFGAMQVDLGSSLPAQRKLDTWARLQMRARSGVPDPELEALFLQFGRYLAIAGSRDGLPTNLQGLWLVGNHPPWHGDYHTDINVEMNYWLPDRAGLGDCFGAFADFCLAQHEAWTEDTRRWFNDPRNPFRNTSGKIAGWTVAISVNPWGGDGWRWDPAGSAWLCNNLWHHYQYTLDRDYLERVFPLLKGACEFWQARLIETTVTDPGTGKPQTVLIDDHDWSPEQGPENARGITYAQELVWDLFGHFAEACRVLGRDGDYAKTITAMRKRLYLPRVSPVTGWLEEWMSPYDLGSPTHRHLSPLMGLFPGDRIVPGQSPEALVEGAKRLLIARGMHSYGWANAWRALCWDRLKNGEKAYQLLLNNLTPTRGKGNGTAMNLFDVYELGDHGVFQIDANFGTPAAMLGMLLYSRPGRIELLPALPHAWPQGRVTGMGARGGFVVDLAWSHGKPGEVVLHSVGGTSTTLAYGRESMPVTLGRGGQLRLVMTDGKWSQA